MKKLMKRLDDHSLALMESTEAEVQAIISEFKTSIENRLSPDFLTDLGAIEYCLNQVSIPQANIDFMDRVIVIKPLSPSSFRLCITIGSVYKRTFHHLTPLEEVILDALNWIVEVCKKSGEYNAISK
jgi:hypothetical protein